MLACFFNQRERETSIKAFFCTRSKNWQLFSTRKLNAVEAEAIPASQRPFSTQQITRQRCNPETLTRNFGGGQKKENWKRFTIVDEDTHCHRK